MLSTSRLFISTLSMMFMTKEDRELHLHSGKLKGCTLGSFLVGVKQDLALEMPKMTRPVELRKVRKTRLVM